MKSKITPANLYHPAQMPAPAKKAPAKTAPAKKSPSPNKPSSGICFTIMPFGGYFDAYYKTIYQPAIEAAGMEPCRADDIYMPSAIIDDIWDLTQRAKVLLADLTGRNPNVFYELGLAHSLPRPVILITDSMEDVPFDLRSLRILTYDKNLPDWGTALKKSITKAIGEVLADPNRAVPPTFLKVKPAGAKASSEVTQTEKELIALRQDMDAMKRNMETAVFRRPSSSGLGLTGTGPNDHQRILSVLRTAFKRMRDEGFDVANDDHLVVALQRETGIHAELIKSFLRYLNPAPALAEPLDPFAAIKPIKSTEWTTKK